jgi:hypothetical protein
MHLTSLVVRPASSSRLLSASGVFASLRGSTYGLGKRLFIQAMGGSENSLRFASSLAAALLHGLSEQPAGIFEPVRDVQALLVSQFVNTLLAHLLIGPRLPAIFLLSGFPMA